MISVIALIVAATLSQNPRTPTPTPRPSPPPILVPGVNAPAPTKPPEQTREPPVTYVIGPQDQLKIIVFDEEAMSGTYAVDADGSITFPLINRIVAGGLTVSQFQDRLRAKLADGYLNRPQVSVSIQQYKSQKVSVFGEVRTPGPITMSGQLTLVDALALAGSTLPSAGNDVTVSRQKRNAAGAVPNANDVDIIHVNLKDVLLGRAGRDLILQDNDLIVVPKAQMFTVNGEVRTTGVIIWEEGMTAEEAIARAGGVTDRGTTRGITAKRLVGGKPREVKLKLEDKVMPDDIITVHRKLF